ncbi:MAG: glutamine-hydrolyzing GMP synthase [Candidatus Ancaeobacter aquaticus]|nr:glutamine-hydrolyzing GMP synthase [Candidatus Ancaeobacter aquaticus]
MSQELAHDVIVVLDFGSQYSQLIARRVRENNVFSIILPYNVSVDEIKKHSPKGLILSGGPANVNSPDAPHCHKEIFEMRVPVLGICYGLQLETHLLGGKVNQSDKREYGRAELKITDSTCKLFEGLPQNISVWMSHGDKVEVLPDGFQTAAITSSSPCAVVQDVAARIYGLQFHPEVVHTPNGKDIIKNYLFKVCDCKGDWTMESFIESSLREIKNRVGDKKVVLGLSGGVDSSVAAMLINKAIGDQLTCIFVNNGVLRKNEADKVVNTFRDNFKINLEYVDATDRFLEKLQGVVDPEKKRKVIGNEFIRVFEEGARCIGEIDFLAQGTLYPDVVESVSAKGGPSATIKTHHNVGGLPEDMKFELIEPFRELFKDEVREIGRELGLPNEIIQRQPFPGPGLAVRIVGEVTRERLDILREADARVVEEVKNAGLYEEIWQSFAVLLPIKTVGVMGDERTYENVIAVRAVNSTDGMTADWVHLPYELLALISNRIINEVRGVNRVVYDISSKPPSTIEWE